MSTVTSNSTSASADGSRPTAASTRKVRAHQRREAGVKPTTQIIVTAILAIVALYFLVPVYWVIVNATKSSDALFGTNGFWFGGNVLTANGGAFPRWAVNSLVYSGVGAIFATYFAVAAGYALAKYEFPGRNAIFAFVLGGVLVPGTATALPLFMVFSKIGLTDTYWAVLIPSLLSPFGLFLARIYAQASVPDEVLEAARLDGAGEMKIFHSIVLRQLIPAIVTIFLFQFVAVWNNYLLPLVMLADEKLYPITLGLNNWRGQTDRLPEFYELTVGGALLSVIPLAILIIILQRFWKGGLTDGSVKG
jgi:multiple sugar transport system permease protein